MSSKVILDADTIKRAITRISFEIIEHHKDLRELILVGVKTRGIPLAARIAERIEALEGLRVDTLDLDIRNYRDDRPPVVNAPLVFDVAIEGRSVILVDDVLYTGRSIRAALDALIRVGRPKTIELAVLVDRGHRELPIRPDYIGKNIPTARDEVIAVHLVETDGHDQVVLSKR
jgi:pyrimidine operon attenuation protein/uracil phosphoribosyltransferase